MHSCTTAVCIYYSPLCSRKSKPSTEMHYEDGITLHNSDCHLANVSEVYKCSFLTSCFHRVTLDFAVTEGLTGFTIPPPKKKRKPTVCFCEKMYGRFPGFLSLRQTSESLHFFFYRCKQWRRKWFTVYSLILTSFVYSPGNFVGAKQTDAGHPLHDCQVRQLPSRSAPKLASCCHLTCLLVLGWAGNGKVLAMSSFLGVCIPVSGGWRLISCNTHHSDILQRTQSQLYPWGLARKVMTITTDGWRKTTTLALKCWKRLEK